MNQKKEKIKYFFILGNNPALSLAELFGLLNDDIQDFSLNNNARIITFCKDFLIVELDKKIDANKLMGLLGGTIKIGIILENPNVNNVNIEARDLIEEINIDKNKKFYFGFSAYGKLNANLKQLAMDLKKELKQNNISSRWVVSSEKHLSSVVVKKNKLISENGTEWCALKNKDKIFWGRTLAVQEFEDYGRRDFHRPKRDAKSGMIPPKLAKMMINIARFEINYKTKNDITLLDPFCGSGTILQEAAILEIDKLIGSDLSEKAAQDANQNLKWIKEYKNLKTNLAIFHSDVRKLSRLISIGSVDLIVTEPYLGPPLVGQENENTINKIIKELSGLYLSAFEEFKKILKEGGCVCMVWPVFITYRKNIYLSIFDEVKKNGFKQVDFDANKYAKLNFDDKDEFKNFKKNLAGSFSKNGNIIYGREGQMVKREIAVFKL